MKMLIDGHQVSRDEVIEVCDPQDGTLVDTVPAATLEDVDEALVAAVRGAASMARLPTHRRMAILQGAAERVASDAALFAETIAREGVKTIREARKEVSRCIDTLRLAAEEARRVGGETIRFDQCQGAESKVGYWLREPVGIVAAITPFNDPLNLVAHKVGPALAGGNAVILKPDSKAPLSGVRLVVALHEAGAPAGAVQVLTGPGAVIGEALVTDARVRMVSFTGGVRVGERVARLAGMKRLGMELGSNCPVLIAADAELERAVPACASGAFWAAGQNCLHVQRIIVHERSYEEFRSRFVAAAEALVVGDKLDEGTDMGPLIDAGAADRVEQQIRLALDAGARLLTGGRRQANYVWPTVLEDLPDSVPLSCEEIYGPVTVLSRCSSLEEAVRIANSVDYGLQAAIFTESIAAAHQAIRDLRYGGVMVNESTDFRIDAMPFGGVKRSGLGREGVRFAVEEMTEPKVVCFQL